MPDINTHMAARLRRGQKVEVFVQASSYYNGEANEQQQAVAKMESLARVAGVKIDMEIIERDGKRIVVGTPK